MKLFYDIIIASIVVWRSYFAHSCCQINLTLFCRKSTFVVIYAPILGSFGSIFARVKKLYFSMSGLHYLKDGFPNCHFILSTYLSNISTSPISDTSTTWTRFRARDSATNYLLFYWMELKKKWNETTDAMHDPDKRSYSTM